MGELANRNRQRSEEMRIQNWTKLNMEENVRMRDWVECGGETNGRYRLAYTILPGETKDAALNRTYRKFDLCMINKGYQWTWQFS